MMRCRVVAKCSPQRTSGRFDTHSPYKTSVKRMIYSVKKAFVFLFLRLLWSCRAVSKISVRIGREQRICGCASITLVKADN
jgi:hypothetical protein